ncbi:MAG: serine/threonine protein kinase [Myxococcales bacterium]|nr:serine/threonine protein kinase [Myxococcales bacterium]
MEPSVGAVFGEHYQLDRCLGQGGMGVVWAATDARDGKRVALKFLRPQPSDDLAGSAPHFDARAVRRFSREARAAMAVDHPNVIRIHEIRTSDPVPFIVMEFLDGESLAERLGRGALSLGELARVLLPVVSAVGSIHAAGIVHRDLKPDNIFLVRRPNGTTEVRVLDFGIARLTATEGAAAQSGLLTNTGAMIGTPYYMAPEQFYNEKDLDHRADVWALGVIAYECLSGRRPIEGESLGQIFKGIALGTIEPIGTIVPGLPSDVEALLGAMLTFDRNARTRDLREVHAVLSRHSDLSTMTFAAPSRPIELDEPRPAVVRVTPDAHAMADTLGPEPAPREPAVGTGSLEGTLAASESDPPRRSRVPLVAVALVVVAAAGGIVAMTRSRGESGTMGSAVGGSAVATSATSSASTASIASPSASALAPSALASTPAVAPTTPAASSSAAPAMPVLGAKVAAKPSISVAPSPSAVASATAAPSATDKAGFFKGW